MGNRPKILKFDAGDFHRIDGGHQVFTTFPGRKGWRREVKKEKGRRDVR